MKFRQILRGEDRKTSLAVLIPAALIALLVVGLAPDLLDRLMRGLRLDQKLSLAWQSGLITVVLFGLLIGAALLWGALAGATVTPLGRAPLKAGGLGLALGLAGLLVATGYAALAGSLHWTVIYAHPSVVLIVVGTCLTLFQCAAEEIYFRGWIQPVAAASWGPWAGLVVTSLLFAALHVFAGVRAPLSMLNIFLAGMVFGLLAIRTGGLAAPVLAHFAWDWAESILLGLYPNPGVDVWNSMWNMDLIGPPLWGGSAEGLNGSLGVTFVLLALCVPLARGLVRPAAPLEAA